MPWGTQGSNPTAVLRALSTFNTSFLRTLDLEIAPSVGKWPTKKEAKHGPLTLKTIRHCFKMGFDQSKDSYIYNRYARF
jgi:hypothetical protein